MKLLHSSVQPLWVLKCRGGKWGQIFGLDIGLWVGDRDVGVKTETMDWD